MNEPLYFLAVSNSELTSDCDPMFLVMEESKVLGAFRTETEAGQAATKGQSCVVRQCKPGLNCRKVLPEGYPRRYTGAPWQGVRVPLERPLIYAICGTRSTAFQHDLNCCYALEPAQVPRAQTDEGVNLVIL